ncbi:excisionase [Aquabacterium sp. OR-4]|uniref:excisionase n=1 Tax=Aquabacterium sp. OR-4 TaxID=2978127 RepID=UPI0021B2A102|nr:excisionase [Aquabacterium sp. OR-4]MDT7836626.1 excisionase [Aquabacterium sp. OR-4]
MTLAEWGAMRFTTPPSAYVLRQLCRRGLFDPPVEKIGRTWYIREDAVLLTADARGHDLEVSGDPGAPPRRLTLVEKLKLGGAI